jgi:hypothetical protein
MESLYRGQRHHPVGRPVTRHWHVALLSGGYVFDLRGLGGVWALTPLPIALSMISKVLAFATAVSLFLPSEKSAWFAHQPVPASQ